MRRYIGSTIKSKETHKELKAHAVPEVVKAAVKAEETVLYFAYGSNMWLAQMQTRCPGSVKLGRAILSKYKWIINARGYANVVKAKKHAVEGVLYSITKTNEKTLDVFEGVAQGCYSKVMLPVEYNGSVHQALVYIDPIVIEGLPKVAYVKRINAGLKDAKLSKKYVNFIRRSVPAVVK